MSKKNILLIVVVILIVVGIGLFQGAGYFIGPKTEVSIAVVSSKVDALDARLDRIENCLLRQECGKK